MAGLGRRTFAAGEVLTASNVMGYLQDQAVMNFAGTAARGSAIGTAVSEGMVSYLADQNQIDVFDGSLWQKVYPAKPLTGNIVQVVTATSSTVTQTTSASYVSTTLVASITPTSASNKILILVSIAARSGSTTSASSFTLFRGTISGTNLGTTSGGVPQGFNGFYSSTSADFRGVVSHSYIDSPNTTSSVTYTSAMLAGSGGNITAQFEGRIGSITLLEVVA